MNNSKTLLKLNHLTKVFPGVIAVDDITMEFGFSEIHGIVGENGAGKSCLIKMIMGSLKKTSGDIVFDKELVDSLGKNERIVSCIYQELNIVPNLSIVENIFLGNLKKKLIFLNKEYMRKKSIEILSYLGLDNINVDLECGKIGVAQQQLVEIARALVLNTKLIIMDEPSASLGKLEINRLLSIIKKLKKDGISVILVTHKLDEIFEVCDKVTVIRDGKLVFTKQISDVDKDILIEAMVGRKIDDFYPKEYYERREVVFETSHLTEKGIIYDISFKAYSGQITGFAGLVGAGRTRTMRAIFGADRYDSGKIFVKGKEVNIRKPKNAINAKIAFITEDRKKQGLVMSLSTSTNLIMANIDKYKKGLLLNQNYIYDNNKKNIDMFNIKAPSINTPVYELSGGNQQKIAIAKWINTDADIYIFDEPTRGIDVGSKIEVYNIMNKLVKNGKCIIMVSSEMPEILGMSDEVVVMHKGRVVKTISRTDKEFNSNDIMKYAFGE